MKDNNDALRELFSGLENDILAQGGRANIMARVRETEVKFKERKERRFEWAMFAVATVLIAGVITAIRYFWWENRNREVPIARNSNRLIDDITMYSEEIQQSFELPKIPEIPEISEISQIKFPEISFDIPPVFIFFAVCGTLLLVFDRFIRRRYNRKHFTEM